ncbi:hypothetical protein CATRI_10430 [Corynebacterium atrinae]|nr:hypothetical protein CATRI_10430 [Corynebacterium atrinae]
MFWWKIADSHHRAICPLHRLSLQFYRRCLMVSRFGSQAIVFFLLLSDASAALECSVLAISFCLIISFV